jgi:inosine-uridine nucleoside N-ribohydrolase
MATIKIADMKKIGFLLLLFFNLTGSAQHSTAVPIIFDTDIAPDYDDVGAMAMLHAFADKGEARILATISSNAFETTVPTLSVLNTYFNRPDIPVGVVKADKPNKDCSQQWAQAIIANYPHALQSNDQADENSPLDGKALVKKKVKQLVSMAARIGKDGKTGYEFNVMVDPAATKKVFAEWPTPVIISGFEIGEKILTGIRLIHNDRIQNSPVKDAFSVALAKDSNTIGRNSWDETAVLIAVRGIAPWFGSRKVNFDVEADGKNVLIPGKKFTYLTFKQTPQQIAKVIEDLMMHQPKNN